MLFPSRSRRWAQACCWCPAQLARGGATGTVSSGALTDAMRSWSIERGDALQQTWGHDACCAERVSRYIRLRGRGLEGVDAGCNSLLWHAQCVGRMRIVVGELSDESGMRIRWMRRRRSQWLLCWHWCSVLDGAESQRRSI